ncbi:metalloendopeptidase CpaA [Acinetobacter calcoaceticus]|uniref:metalloendopeptidase CpaA n=1 Tax=Acinetobacter calcoaceticus TaxID=471 RepID=UPI00321A7B14
MNFKLKTSFIIGAIVASSLVYAATVLSPNQNNNSGSIPSGYSDLEFSLANGNWVKNLSLPASANNLDKITIRSSAAYSSYLDTSNTNIPLEVLKINSGDVYQFIFNTAQNKWIAQLATVSPTNGANYEVVPLTTASIQKVLIENDKWAQTIALPSDVRDGTTVQIVSTASADSNIDKANLLFPSSFLLKNGFEYWFKYYSALGKWVPEYIKPQKLNVQQIGTSLAAVSSPLTEVSFGDGNWVFNFTLPTTASDRDRIIIKSTATWSAKINNTNINSQATLTLKTGDQYEFMYVSDKGYWQLISSPTKVIDSSATIPAILPNMTQPALKVKLSTSNWQPTLQLPVKAQVGDKVVIASNASADTYINAANGLSTAIKNGENRRFIYTVQGWSVDSYTIDMLLVSSPEVNSILGESAAKLRMIEGVNLTNLTAENSNARFYLRDVGYLTYKIPAATLKEAISFGRDDTTVQNERKRVLADGVYYQGNEPGDGGCGWAWINASSYNMIGANDIAGCSFAAMRHEVGHNLGLYHNGSTNIGSGFAHPLGSTAMGGNNINFYSSPYLYNPKYGVRLGEEGKIDAVSVINLNAQKISLYN